MLDPHNLEIKATCMKPASPSPDTGILVPIEILLRHPKKGSRDCDVWSYLDLLHQGRSSVLNPECLWYSMIFHNPSCLGSCPIPSDLTLRVSGNLRSCASPQKLWAHCPEKLPRGDAVSGGTLWPRDGRGLLSSTWPLPCLSCLEWWLGGWTLSQKWIWMIPRHCTALGFQPFCRLGFSAEDIFRWHWPVATVAGEPSFIAHQTALAPIADGRQVPGVWHGEPLSWWAQLWALLP